MARPGGLLLFQLHPDEHEQQAGERLGDQREEHEFPGMHDEEIHVTRSFRLWLASGRPRRLVRNMPRLGFHLSMAVPGEAIRKGQMGDDMKKT